MYRALIALLTCGLVCAAESFESCATGAVSKLQMEYGALGGGIFRARIRACSCTRNSMKHSPLRGESFIGSKGSTGKAKSEKLKPTLTGIHPQHAPFGGC